TFTSTVSNAAPTVAISGAPSVAEGSPYTLNVGAVTDPGTDTVTSYTIHWGDSSPDTTISAAALGTASGNVPHTYADGPNTYPITVDLTDEDGTYLDQANALNAVVTNAAPTVAANTATATENEGE